MLTRAGIDTEPTKQKQDNQQLENYKKMIK